MKPDPSLLQTFRISLAVILLVHLIFFIVARINNPVPLTDSVDYLFASQNFYSHGVLYCGNLSDPIREEQFTRRPPLYPLLLGIVMLTGSEAPALLLQILISMTSVFLMYRIFFMDKSGAHAIKPLIPFATLLILATPAQYIYPNRIMAEILFQFTLVLMAWSIYNYFNTQKSHHIWLFNLFLTLGMATKPVLFPFALLTLFISVILFIRTKKGAFITAIIIPVLWITVYITWNYNRTGSIQYSSIQTANLVNYNLRYFLTEQDGSEPATIEVDRLYAVCGEEKEYRDKNKCLEQGVREILMEQPLKYSFFHFKGSFRYFIDPGRFDLVTFFNVKQKDSPGLLDQLNVEGLKGVFRTLRQQGKGLVAILGFIALFKVVKFTGFIIYLFRGSKQIPFRIFLGMLVGYLALVTGPLGASRFLLPVELLIIGSAVLGWSSLLKAQVS